MKDEDPIVRARATQTLAHYRNHNWWGRNPITKSAVPALIEALKDTNPSVRRAAVRYIPMRDSQLVVEMVEDKDPLVRREAVRTLGSGNFRAPRDKPGIDEVVLALIGAVKDEDRERTRRGHLLSCQYRSHGQASSAGTRRGP